MPEGPEIRRAADKIAKVLEHQQIEAVDMGLERLKPYEAELSGQRVVGVETRGKALLTHFDNGLSIYSHNQLYGVWKVSKRGDLPRTNRQLRLALHTRSHSALLYSASDIGVWPTTELGNHPFLRKIGPDIMDNQLSWQQLASRLEDQAFSGRSLASLYLDQKFMAGLGNYLRSEILFDSGLHPDLKPKQLSPQQRQQLAQSTLSISRRSYDTGGYTVDTELLTRLKISKAPYESIRFMVFNREALPCRRCSTEIVRATRTSRRIYWCPSCQPLSK